MAARRDNQERQSQSPQQPEVDCRRADLDRALRSASRPDFRRDCVARPRGVAVAS